MASRAAQVADAVRDLIQAIWLPSAPNGIQRVWAGDIVLNPDDPANLIQGRQVYVFPVSLTQPTLLNRLDQMRRYLIAVLVAERYTDAPGPIPASWVDDRVDFVENAIFTNLSNPGVSLLEGAVRLVFDEEQGIDILADREVLQQQRTFWSVMTLIYQEVV